jgi:hypothetical protein
MPGYSVMMKVEVGVLGEPLIIFAGPINSFTDTDWELPWEDRLHVSLDVSPSDTVGDILDAAAEKLGIFVSDAYYDIRSKRVADNVRFVKFFRDNEDEGRFGPKLTRCTIRRSDGAALFNQWIFDVPIERIVDAQQNGLFVGDPYRIYLLPQPPGGGSFDSVDWVALIFALKTAESWLSRLGGVADGLGAVRAIWNKGRKVVVALKGRIAGCNGDMGDVCELVDTRTVWSERDLAELLGSSPNEVAQLLPLFGLERSDEGLWAVGESDAAKRSRALIYTVLHVTAISLTLENEASLLEIVEEVMGMSPLPSPSEIGELAYQRLMIDPFKGEWEPPQ